jgi:serine/threonine protein kinase
MGADTNTPEWSEVERVVADTIELPEDEQAAYLAQQPSPIRDEAESLLAAYRRSGSFLEQSTVACSPGASAALTPDTQVGPYRIEAVIGEGGMGIVYRARDTRLNRTVAIKFLFEDLADAATRHRFQREAEMASSLNHPHIVTVHDSGDFEGRQYLVTEYLDGGTLRDWARAQRRTWREIAELMSGLADGLATAHNAGILHRDLKPENILVSRNGHAKLSDFGLAKLQQPVESEQTLELPTPHSTRSGIIMGTISYMSPEQAAGRAVDTRSDIFSFGIVLYELIAVRRPFDGATDLETLQKIIHGPVPSLSADVPFALRILLEKALDKDPAARYQSTRDLAVDLRRLVRQSEGGTPEAPSVTVKQQPPRFGKNALALTAIILAISLFAAGGLSIWLRRPIASSPVQAVEFEVPPPTGTLFAPPLNRQAFAISPDGRQLAFTSASGTGTNLWMRQLDSTEMHAVPGTEGAISISWAPDSRSIFFSTKQTLMQLNLETGSGRSVATLPSHAQLVTWRANGNLLLYLGAHDSYELSAEDGSLHKLVPNAIGRWPQFLPGSDRLLYAEFDASAGSYRAYVSDYPAHKPVALMETGSRVQYAPPRREGEPGYLLFMRGANLLAQASDEGATRLVGDAFPIAQNVIYYGPTLAANFSVSKNGVLVYQAGFPVSELHWYDRAGNVVGEVGKPATHWGNVRISRDGRRVAATVWTPETGGAGIWIFDANGSASRRITFPPDVQRRPVWAPDGARLAFGGSKNVGGSPRLAILDLASNGALTASAAQFEQNVPDVPTVPTDWSRDGRFIAFDDGTPHEVQGAYITDLAARKTLPVLQDKFAQWGIAFSPDGAQIAFVSAESGRPEAYLQLFDPKPLPHLTGERRQLSKDGAWLLRWRGDGHELFYLGLDNQLYAVPVSGRLASGIPKSLFRIAGPPQYNTTRDFQFDVSPDGQRFIMPTTGSVAPPAFTVVENWQDKFRR